MKSCVNPKCRRTNPQPTDQFRPAGQGKSYRKYARGTCLGCEKDQARTYYLNNKAQSRGSLLRAKYWPHMTWQEALAEYARLFALQNGVCAVCKQPELTIEPRSDEFKLLAVDHIHGTSIIRGLLCQRCNTAIGQLKDRPEICEAAAHYLRGHAPKVPETDNVVSLNKTPVIAPVDGEACPPVPEGKINNG